MNYLLPILAILALITGFVIQQKYNLVSESEYHNLIQTKNQCLFQELNERYP